MDSMRLSVSAARNGALVNNIVLTTTASVEGIMVFIIILVKMYFVTAATLPLARRPCHGVKPDRAAWLEAGKCLPG